MPALFTSTSMRSYRSNNSAATFLTSLMSARSPMKTSTGAALAWEQRPDALAGRWRRAVIDVALRRDGRTDSLRHGPDDLDHPLAAVHPGLDEIADLNGRGRLGRSPTDANVAASAGVGRQGAGLVHADGPQPLVDPGALHRDMVARVAGQVASRRCLARNASAAL